jgi:hypothetical protein
MQLKCCRTVVIRTRRAKRRRSYSITAQMEPLIGFYAFFLLPASLIGCILGRISANQEGRPIASSWLGIIANGIPSAPGAYGLVMLL